MATRTEERLKSLFDERMNITLQKISEHTHSIFIWGVVVGIVVSYTNLLSLAAGFSLGYIAAKKELPLVELAITKTFFLFENSGLFGVMKIKN